VTRALVGTLLALLGGPLSPASDSVQRGWATTGDVALRIWLPTGSVQVECWDRDSIDVRGTTGTASVFFGGVGAGGASAKFGVEARRRDDPALPSGQLRVMVPRRARVAIKMTDGTAEARGIGGSLEVLSVSGDVRVRDASGTVSVETIDAEVTLERIAGGVRVRNGSGAVVLTDLQGSLALTSVGGAVQLTGTGFGDGRIETVGGAIAVRGSPRPDARLELSSHDGHITLALDRARLPRLDLASRGGGVTNALGVGTARHGEIVARSFKGRINVVGTGGIEGRKPPSP
jgi:hypothetical protein